MLFILKPRAPLIPAGSRRGGVMKNQRCKPSVPDIAQACGAEVFHEADAFKISKASEETCIHDNVLQRGSSTFRDFPKGARENPYVMHATRIEIK